MYILIVDIENRKKTKKIIDSFLVDADNKWKNYIELSEWSISAARSVN